MLPIYYFFDENWKRVYTVGLYLYSSLQLQVVEHKVCHPITVGVGLREGLQKGEGVC